jgi:glycosyltransferase involved in cell wall biosynthesis
MKISVIIPVYNAEQYLAEALDSVLTQTHTDFDLIVIDDGSTDGSLAILQAYAERDARIQFHSQVNRGAGETRNRALAMCQTEWVFLMDADDVMIPNRLERQIAFIQANPDLAVASCRAVYINGDGIEGGRTVNPLPTRETLRKLVDNGEAIGLLNPGVALHRLTVQAIGGFRGQFFPAEDCDLWNRLTEQGHVLLVQDEILMKYRVHSKSAVTSNFHFCRQKYEWVRSCMASRRAGNPEPSWEAFLSTWSAAPWWEKLNRWRKTQAKCFYRLAGQCKIDGNLPAAILNMGCAAVLQPIYTVNRLKAQFLQ